MYLLIKKYFIYLIILFDTIKLMESASNDTDDAEWIAYKQKYRKGLNKYNSLQEETLRRGNWQRVLSMVKKNNALYAKGEVSFQMECNFLADWSKQELERLNGFRPINYKNEDEDCFSQRKLHHKNRINLNKGWKNWFFYKRQTVPSNFSWVSVGAVSPVQDQGECGSCWAYATTGSLEGAYYRKTGKVISVSEQQLIDCNYNQRKGNWGCEGGYYQKAVEYLNQNGFQNHSTYPNIGIRAACNANSNYYYKDAKVEQFCNTYGTENNEILLKSVLYNKWPVAAAINVANSFFFHKSGVYKVTDCKNSLESLNHAVLIVGYGTENGMDYWLVKNSWSTDWGDNGYIKIARNLNMCGIAIDTCFVELSP